MVKPMQEEEFLSAIQETQALGQYNAERARGIVHTPEWAEKMAELQRMFDGANPDFVEPRVPRGYTTVARSLEAVAEEPTIRLTPAEWRAIAEDPDVEDQSAVG